MRSNTSLYGVVKEGIASLDIQTKILKRILNYFVSDFHLGFSFGFRGALATLPKKNRSEKQRTVAHFSKDFSFGLS